MRHRLFTFYKFPHYFKVFYRCERCGGTWDYEPTGTCG